MWLPNSVIPSMLISWQASMKKGFPSSTEDSLHFILQRQTKCLIIFFKYQYLEYGIGQRAIFNNVKGVIFSPLFFFEYVHGLMDIFKSNVLLSYGDTLFFCNCNIIHTLL